MALTGRGAVTGGVGEGVTEGAREVATRVASRGAAGALTTPIARASRSSTRDLPPVSRIL